MEKECDMVVEILMATYNGGKYLEEQLRSIEEQTFKHWHLTVHDDGSTDETLDVLEAFQKRMGKDKVTFRKNDVPSGSAKANFLGLIKEAEGDYFMCCDQDDRWHINKIAMTLHRMRQMEQRYGRDLPLLVHTDLRVVDSRLKEIHPSFHAYTNLEHRPIPSLELVQNQVTGCTMMFNNQLKQYVERIDNTDPILMHDHFLALIACAFGKMSYIDKATIDYRQHEENSVGAQDARSLSYMWNRFKRGKEAFRMSMEDSCRQAGYFMELYEPYFHDRRMRRLFQSYADLYTQNKWKRIDTCLHNRFMKKGVVRKVMQIIWG